MVLIELAKVLRTLNFRLGVWVWQLIKRSCSQNDHHGKGCPPFLLFDLLGSLTRPDPLVGNSTEIKQVLSSGRLVGEVDHATLMQ